MKNLLLKVEDENNKFTLLGFRLNDIYDLKIFVVNLNKTFHLYRKIIS